jgi:hypothetical protein
MDYIEVNNLLCKDYNQVLFDSYSGSIRSMDIIQKTEFAKEYSGNLFEYDWEPLSEDLYEE